MHISTLSLSEATLRLQSRAHAAQTQYWAMYSSYLGGIVCDPALMVVPLDDHMVHRGDGVFEAIKFVEKKVYALRPHLNRLQRSADLIELALPNTLDEIEEIALATVRAGKRPEGLIRIFVSRGPGGFSTNPRESIGPQLYVVATQLNRQPREKYQDGVRVGISQVPVKEGFWATAKTCNYLPNVLMKAEALKAGLDFMVSLDDEGFLTESSTENFALIRGDGAFVAPKLAHILSGVTMLRTMELAKELEKRGEISAVVHADIAAQDVVNAREAFMLGTTLDVLPVVEFSGRPIGNGKPGPLAARLLKLLLEDQQAKSDWTTDF